MKAIFVHCALCIVSLWRHSTILSSPFSRGQQLLRSNCSVVAWKAFNSFLLQVNVFWSQWVMTSVSNIFSHVCSVRFMISFWKSWCLHVYIKQVDGLDQSFVYIGAQTQVLASWEQLRTMSPRTGTKTVLSSSDSGDWISDAVQCRLRWDDVVSSRQRYRWDETHYQPHYYIGLYTWVWSQPMEFTKQCHRPTAPRCCEQSVFIK